MVPIYLHPVSPLEQGLSKGGLYDGAYPNLAKRVTATTRFSWHVDVGVHILRLFAEGVFDRHPKLKILVGHFGEMLPFMLGQIAQFTARFDLRRKLKEAWSENIWITTAGVHVGCGSHGMYTA